MQLKWIILFMACLTVYPPAVTAFQPQPPSLPQQTCNRPFFNPAGTGNPPDLNLYDHAGLTISLKASGDANSLKKAGADQKAQPANPPSEVKAGGTETVLPENDHSIKPASQGQALTATDWQGLARDTGFFLAYQPFITGIWYLLADSVMEYSPDQKKISFDKWWNNEKSVHWDGDNFWLNNVAHPFWGASYYIRARERGVNRLGSFGYSVLMSAVFEFGAESVYEPPALNDMIATPVLGSLVGAFLFEPLRDYLKSKPRLSWYDHTALILTDPLGAINSVVEKLLGMESSIRLTGRPSGESQPQILGVEYVHNW